MCLFKPPLSDTIILNQWLLTNLALATHFPRPRCMSKDRRQPKVLRVDLIVLPKAWRFVGANMCYTSYTVIPWMT